ncbi:hypothetical protein C366_05751 [Cryptococcus neoformans Tu401-1]|nr:hypothetical protein C365_05679 [Cryptococcus neoformans var. grubii Bt85]OXG12029.1 hypothetical protein C366_05751 [Cryptococcus neoformans var. grubii Tu401-1]OXM76590.1 hypothetical protein C364_05668 [Cryptococcus neoformans var. grubii Bt63]
MRATLGLFLAVSLLSTALAASSLPSQTLSHGPTTLISGLPGFTVLDNVWYRNRTFYILEDEGEIPQTDRLLSLSGSSSGTQSVERVNWKEMVSYNVEDGSPKEAQAKPDVEIKELHGITLFFNDGWDGKWSGYKWLYHMVAEALLGSLSILSSVPPLSTSIQSQGQGQAQDTSQGRVTYGGDGKLPDRLVIAWDYNWDARYGLPRAVAEALFGDDKLIEPEEWTQMTSQDTWIYFERVLLVDRNTAHRHNPLARQWFKMAIDAYSLASSPSFFFPTRHALLSNYDIPTYTRSAPGLRLSGKKPKIVYVDRQRTTRKFDVEVHTQLLKQLKKIERAKKAVVVDAVLEDLEKKKQFEMFTDADVSMVMNTDFCCSPNPSNRRSFLAFTAMGWRTNYGCLKVVLSLKFCLLPLSSTTTLLSVLHWATCTLSGITIKYTLVTNGYPKIRKTKPLSTMGHLFLLMLIPLQS